MSGNNYFTSNSACIFNPVSGLYMTFEGFRSGKDSSAVLAMVRGHGILV
jgi:hypothetical protein